MGKWVHCDGSPGDKKDTLSWAVVVADESVLALFVVWVLFV